MAEGGNPGGELRILLVGKTGHGKSSTGNTILDEEYFKVDKSPSSVTIESDYKEGKRFGRKLVVVDTPGFFDTHRSQQEIRKELLKTLAFTTPGFHAIVFVLKPDRFTKELHETRALFFDWFGKGVEKHSLMILTETRDEKDVNNFFSKAQEELRDLREMCGGVVVPFDNNADSKLKEKQVKHLFHCIDKIESNQGSHFSNVWFKLAMLYINNKCPKELSKDSVIILEKAGVNKKEMEKICILVDEDETNETSSVSSGKLRIFDTSHSGGGIYKKCDQTASSEAFPSDESITTENEMNDHGSVGGAKYITNKPSQITPRKDRIIEHNFEVNNEGRQASFRKGRKENIGNGGPDSGIDCIQKKEPDSEERAAKFRKNMKEPRMFEKFRHIWTSLIKKLIAFFA